MRAARCHGRIGDDHRCGRAFQFHDVVASITQLLALWTADLGVSRRVLMGCINVFLWIAGFFLPPEAVILMTAPTLVLVIDSMGFDPICFAVMLTINMEIGLITPPLDLNFYVINGRASDVSLPLAVMGQQL